MNNSMKTEGTAAKDANVTGNNDGDLQHGNVHDKVIRNEDPLNVNDTTTAKQGRRQSIRRTSEPERFVARPSQQGLGVEEGDQIFMAGGIRIGGMMARGDMDDDFVSDADAAAIMSSLEANNASTDCKEGKSDSVESSPLALLSAAAGATKQELVATANSCEGGSTSMSNTGSNSKRASSSSLNNESKEEEGSNPSPKDSSNVKSELLPHPPSKNDVEEGKSTMQSPLLTRRLFCGTQLGREQSPSLGDNIGSVKAEHNLEEEAHLNDNSGGVDAPTRKGVEDAAVHGVAVATPSIGDCYDLNNSMAQEDPSEMIQGNSISGNSGAQIDKALTEDSMRPLSPDDGGSGENETPTLEYSDTEMKKKGMHFLCKAKGCNKYSQGKHHLCRRHNTIRLSGEKAKKTERSSDRSDQERSHIGINGTLSVGTTTRASTPKQLIEIDSDDDEDNTTASPKMMTTRRSGRRRKSKSQGDDDFLGEDEVKFVFSSGGRQSSPSSPSSSTRKSPQHSSQQFLRRSKRECTPPAKFRAFPLITSTSETAQDSVKEKRRSPKNGICQATSQMCAYDDCTKYKQSGCDGYCMSHFRIASQDSNRQGKKRSNEQVDVPQDNPNNHQKPKKAKHLGVAQSPSHICKTVGCKKNIQSKCKGFCRKCFNDGMKQDAPQPKGSIDIAPRSTEEVHANGRRKQIERTRSVDSSPEELSRSHFPNRGADSLKNYVSKGSPVVAKGRSLRIADNRGGGGGDATKFDPATNCKAIPLKDNGAKITGGKGKGIDGLNGPPATNKDKTPKEKTPFSKPAFATSRPPSTSLEKETDEYDDFSYSELELPAASTDREGQRREKSLDVKLSLQTSSTNQSYWRCGQCGDLNSLKRCSTCRSFEGKISETALLERTRYELLNGRDFWICTHCEIGIHSLTTPCGGCKRMISFVPLEVGEFEEFVRKQRKSNREKTQQWQLKWQQKIEELHCDEWSDEVEEEKPFKLAVNLDWYKNSGPHGHLFCKYHGCKSTIHSNCGEFCREHLYHGDPPPYPLVVDEDRTLVGELLYLVMAQMVPCNYGSGEKRSICDQLIGYPGLACKHCTGKPDSASGRWFPSSEAAIYVGTFAKGLVSHLRNCSHCPAEVKKKLELAGQTKATAKERSKFIHRVWCRVHRIPIIEAKHSGESVHNNETKS